MHRSFQFQAVRSQENQTQRPRQINDETRHQVVPVEAYLTWLDEERPHMGVLLLLKMLGKPRKSQWFSVGAPRGR